MTWANIAPTRPANASDPFDSAYRFQDLDELVRNTQERDMEVLITIWGTPKWANGGKTPNYAPTRLSDLTAFSRAVASRYSGRFAGYPFVRFYSIWNESNLQLFLAPQFDAKGKSVAPRNYAKLAAAAYSGIKAGNSRAKIAVGSTSSAGRDKPLAGKSATHSPGRFAQLVAAANPRLKFDAWAQHPYPVPANQKPTQKVRWPNVTLASFARFEKSLDTWFKRKNVRIWITEYGHEVKQDGEPKGISRAQQAAYAAQALALAKKDARTDMFIWFVFRDHCDEPVAERPPHDQRRREAVALAVQLARRSAVDARNAIVNVKGGTANPTVTVLAPRLRGRHEAGRERRLQRQDQREGQARRRTASRAAPFAQRCDRAGAAARLPAGEGQDVHGRRSRRTSSAAAVSAEAHADRDRHVARRTAGGPGRSPGPHPARACLRSRP